MSCGSKSRASPLKTIQKRRRFFIALSIVTGFGRPDACSFWKSCDTTIFVHKLRLKESSLIVYVAQRVHSKKMLLFHFSLCLRSFVFRRKSEQPSCRRLWDQLLGDDVNETSVDSLRHIKVWSWTGHSGWRLVRTTCTHIHCAHGSQLYNFERDHAVHTDMNK